MLRQEQRFFILMSIYFCLTGLSQERMAACNGAAPISGTIPPCDQQIHTFVFLDLESSGLQGTRPRITELSLVAVHRDALMEEDQGHLRRVVDKLTLCVFPMKPIPPRVTEISGNKQAWVIC